MRAATQVVNMNPAINKTCDRINCQSGGSKANRPIIAIGEVKGMIESQKLAVLCGSSMMSVNRSDV